MKHRLRSYLDRLAAITGLLHLCERGMQRGLTILMYHRVLPLAQCLDYPLASLVIPTDIFRQQMQWLAGHCRVLPLREAVIELDGGGPFPLPLVAVTFDDGYADNFELAAPIMEEHGLRGTFFVTSGFVAQGVPQWYDQAAVAWQHMDDSERRELLGLFQDRNLNGCTLNIQTWMQGLKQERPEARINLMRRAEFHTKDLNLEQYRPMSPDQLIGLHKRGHEIASHTVTHPILPQLDDNKLRQELNHSAEQLGHWIGDKIVGFCYPNGDFNNQIERVVLETGHKYACTVKSGLNLPKACQTRLARLPITMARTMRADYTHDALGFRAELCRLREWWR